ncbi:MAG TPA: phage holin family protein [Chitinophagaceae bacterium]|nr:phage holin family protein [Chitinophagaceae bacterium]
MGLILKLIVNAIAVFAAAHLLPGVSVDGFTTAIIVAIVLGVLNLFVKPVLILLTIPITLLTLGLFLLIINALIVLLCDSLIDGFEVDGLLYALLFSLVVSLISAVMEGLAKKKD